MTKRKKIKMCGRPEGCICDIVAYLQNKVGYPACSDMNELYAMVRKL